mmetsp:Transcript_2804/g.6555  ORF Transcript_2804/g.6555 Transcript_2804/m.6555 type:complete len:397 (+) Transcript_2804:74-1264(+)
MGAQFGVVLECAKRDREPEDERPPETTAAATPLLQDTNGSGALPHARDGNTMPHSKEKIARRIETEAKRRFLMALERVQTLEKQLGAIVAYFIVGYLYYSNAAGWSLLKCLYFSVEVITSVGYGDILPPPTDHALLFTSGYILCGIFIVATVVAQIFDSLVSGAVAEAMTELDRMRDEAMKNMCNPSDDSLIFKETEAKTEGSGRKFKCPDLTILKLLSASIACLVIGMIGFTWFSTVGDLTSGLYDNLNPWVRAFYFAVVTLTTVGFGDVFPTSPGSVLFCTAFMLVGIPTFGLGLAKFANHFTQGLANASASLVQVSKLDQNKFASLVEFESELHQVCQWKGKDGQVDVCEYMAFILVRNGVVSLETVRDIIDGFNRLDRDGSGSISVQDIPTE